MASPSNPWIERVKLRRLIFGLICLGYLAYGCNITLIGVAFQDLAASLRVDSKIISYGITIRHLVNCFAAILAGFSFNYYSRQIQYAVSLVLYGLLMIGLTWIQNVAFYLISSALIGLASAFIDCATNLWVFELFAENINVHVLIVHFSYSVGQIIAPLVTRLDLPDQTDPAGDHRSRAPFLICGSLFFVVASLVIFCYFIKPYEPPKRYIESKDAIISDETDEKEAKSPLPKHYYRCFIATAGLILSLEIANEMNLNYYLPTYLNKSDLQTDQSTVLSMMTVVGVAYALGRLLNIALAIKLDVRVILYCNLVLIVTGNLVLTFLAAHQTVYLTWLSVVLLGLGYSSTFPCLFSFIEQRITITNNLNSLLVFLTSSVFSVNSIVIGNSIDDNPALFQYLNSTFSILFVMLFCVLHSYDMWRKKLLQRVRP